MASSNIEKDFKSSSSRAFVGNYKSPALVDRFFHVLTAFCSFLIIAVIVGIIFVLLKESFPAISQFGFVKFIFSTKWDPVREIFGAGVPLFGTIVTTIIALVFSIPLSIGIAIFVTELAPEKIRGFIGGAIELLAAIPSIIYGMWGLFTLAPIMANYVEPFLQNSLGKLPIFNLLFSGTPIGIDLFTAGIILGIMIIPFSASIARDSILLTPQILKESTYALGTTHWEVIKDVILPYSKYGIFGGIVISLGRALGETMAVAFVLGNKNKLPTSLFDATTTVTVKLANEFTEADKDLYLSSLFYLVLLLFLMSFIILAISKYLIYKSKRAKI